jgi:hypothetical protein
MRPTIEKGFLACVVDGVMVSMLSFDTNPNTLNRQRSAKYGFAQPPGSVLPIAQFGSSGDMSLSFDVFLDGTGQPVGNVRAQIDYLEALVLPRAEGRAPPRVLFGFGDTQSEGVVLSVRTTETMFTRNLEVLRATCTVEIRETFFGREKERSFLAGITAPRLPAVSWEG